MRQIVMVIIATLALSGCESTHDQQVKDWEAQIKNTISTDWKESGIPLGDLLAARSYCQKVQSLRGCTEVASQLIDISISYASCKADQRAKLCKAIVRVINEDVILSILPKPTALTLPEDPWYESLPTRALESQASKFDYRIEVAGWWWQAWHTYVLSCIALFIITIATWKWRCNFKIKKRRQAEYLARQRANQLEQEKQQRADERQIQLENERRAKWLHDQVVSERQRIEAENLAKKKIAEAAAKLAAEQEEAAKVLSSIFSPAEKIQRRNRVADNESVLTSQKTEGGEHD